MLQEQIRDRRCGGLHAPLLLGALILIGAIVAPPPAAAFDSGHAGFAVEVGGEIVRYRVLAIGAMPGEELRIEVEQSDRHRGYAVRPEGGVLLQDDPWTWRWRAPAEPGLHPVEISAVDADDAILLNVFVLVPFERVEDGWLNGYRIGDYPDVPLRGLSIYLPPAGFVEVTPEVVGTPVSPHFELGQFVCKQESGYPRYLVLRPRLLRKLEFVLQRLNAAGVRCDGLVVMSGYRTPWYNRVIGNVKYSRHVWGGAADVYVDVSPRDGQMDDLNGDGRVDVGDAAWVYRIIDDQFGRAAWSPFVGGLGQYRRTAAHGPFVHVDVRGTRARWGD